MNMKHFKEAQLNKVLQAKDLTRQIIADISKGGYIVSEDMIMTEYDKRINSLEEELIELDEQELETNKDDEAEKQGDNQRQD